MRVLEGRYHFVTVYLALHVCLSVFLSVCLIRKKAILASMTMCALDTRKYSKRETNPVIPDQIHFYSSLALSLSPSLSLSHSLTLSLPLHLSFIILTRSCLSYPFLTRSLSLTLTSTTIHSLSSLYPSWACNAKPHTFWRVVIDMQYTGYIWDLAT